CGHTHSGPNASFFAPAPIEVTFCNAGGFTALAGLFGGIGGGTGALIGYATGGGLNARRTILQAAPAGDLTFVDPSSTTAGCVAKSISASFAGTARAARQGRARQASGREAQSPRHQATAA